jgi:hypothetical protein
VSITCSLFDYEEFAPPAWTDEARLKEVDTFPNPLQS